MILAFVSALRRTGSMVAAGLVLWAGQALGLELPKGKASISLVAADGSRLTIGSAQFTAEGEGAAITVSLDAPEFAEEFLSMRPFRCLAGAKETWCHLAYPYTWKGHVTPNDLIDLEYALLFLFKPPAGYGIDAWNGLYFKLSLAADGRISGDLHETDFNVLAVPPDKSVTRPIPHSALTPVSPETHRYARIEIK